MQFYSQYGQDRALLDNFFRGQRGGVFVDAGAGEKHSNTLFFERSMGWTGLRTGALPGGQLSPLLEENGLFRIDYCSLGAGALTALRDLDLERFRISVFTVQSKPGEMNDLMAAKGYDLVGRLEQDEIYKRRDIKMLARTTVICAVWHGETNRDALLRGHAENLARQTVPVEAIYVFDGGDTPPAWLKGHAFAAREDLTIYQAWNVALSNVQTPLVMNLNLDDRLAPDAVETLERGLLQNNATLVGGDWAICYSQDDTDAVRPCFPTGELPPFQSWPPETGARVRLGSGTGESGSLGPATLWRVDAHLGAPRYPFRFADGTLMRIVGDSSWWQVVTQMQKKAAVRLPAVIGNYHSHPGSQAEFRPLPYDEGVLQRDPGISLL